MKNTNHYIFKITSLLLTMCTLTGCGTIPASLPSAEVSEGHDSSASSDEPSSNPLREDEEERVTDYPCLEAVDSLPEGSWQAEKSFPDQTGDVNKTLAMNSMYTFDGYSGQGRLYFEIDDEIESFDLFVNNHEIETSDVTGGIYELDISTLSLNGANTIQVSSIVSETDEAEVTVRIPYPVVIEGNLSEAGIDERPITLIDKIIQSDIDNGFSSAQLAIIKDGRLVYQNAWGMVNSYHPDGSRISDGSPVTNDTLYDLASNTKMYAAAYAIQYLIDRGEISLDDKASDILGAGFVDETLEIRFASFDGNYPGLETIKEWKSQITVKDLLMHQAGFPDSGHYHNDKYDTENQKLTLDVDNVLYVESATKEKTYWEGICRTPLMYEPGTSVRYSDIDYMILGTIVEKITGDDLNSFLKNTFWNPMGLSHITYNPLDNGFGIDDCAATEINGNTREGLVTFPGIRTKTIQGEVHDEESYYTMEGVSGHAGLFANATDLAKLASVMLTGGYDKEMFFSKNTRDLFISPQAGASVNYGIGWWREADDKRVWYFGTQAPESTVGHQGFTGTLTMIDFENNMVIVFLTNAINTPLANPIELENANDFSGRYYTTATLGFVPQLVYMGLNDPGDIDEALSSLIQSMIDDKEKLVKEAEEIAGMPLNDDHPLKRGLKAVQALSLP